MASVFRFLPIVLAGLVLACSLPASMDIVHSVRMIGTQTSATGDVQPSLKLETTAASPVAGVPVEFRLASKTYAAVTDSNGRAKCPVFYNPGWDFVPVLWLDPTAAGYTKDTFAGAAVLKDWQGRLQPYLEFETPFGTLFTDAVGVVSTVKASAPAYPY